MDNHDIDAYTKLTRIALAKVISFNRKRQGEVSKIKKADWSSKQKSSINSEMAVCLNNYERGLLEIFERLEIKG